MSFNHLRRALDLDLPRRQRYILIELADCADARTGESWPGYAYLARKTHYDKSHVRRAIMELIRDGYIRVVEMSKRGQPTRYRLTLEANTGTATNACALSAPHTTNGCSLGTPKEINGKALCTPKVANGCSLDRHGCSLGSSDDIRYPRVLDPVLDPEEQNPPINPPKGGRYPYEFEYYFWDIYPNPVGKGAAFRAFQTLHLTLPQLLGMREAILAHRRYNPRWRPDAQGRVFIPKPTTWLRERRFDDPIPGPKGAADPSRCCEHPPEWATQDARGTWFCSCGHILSPEEAERLGLTAKANDDAREALQQIRSMLGKR